MWIKNVIKHNSNNHILRKMPVIEQSNGTKYTSKTLIIFIAKLRILLTINLKVLVRNTYYNTLIE